MISPERLQSLQTKHAHIETVIAELEKSAFIDTQEVRRLKLEKLKIKEEMETLNPSDDEQRHMA